MTWIQTYEGIYLNWDKIVYLEETECNNDSGAFGDLLGVFDDGENMILTPFPCEKEYEENGEILYSHYLMHEQELFIQAMISIFLDPTEKQPILHEYWHDKASQMMQSKLKG